MAVSRILVSLAVAAGTFTAAGAADLAGKAPHGAQGGAVIYQQQATGQAVESYTILVPPLPRRYPLDGAGFYFPPHPAATLGVHPLYGTGQHVILPNGPPGAVRVGSLPFAHVEWCHARYASYRASDNSFLPPTGLRRTCVSPYLR